MTREFRHRSRFSLALGVLLAALLALPAQGATVYSYVSECVDVAGQIQCDFIGG
jgi:hypothetical protein